MSQTISDKLEKYFSLADAAKLCSYSQEYLSLRARQGKLKAKKQGRNWVTTEEWLKEYIRENFKFQNSKSLPRRQAGKIQISKQEINWPLLVQKFGYGFLILLLGFGLLKISPNIISWTADGVADASNWLIQTGELLEKKSEELSRQNFQFPKASILDNLLALDLSVVVDKTRSLIDYSLAGSKIFAQNVQENALRLAQKINQNDHKIQTRILAEANRTVQAAQFASKKIAQNIENISTNAVAISLRGLGLSLQKIGQAGQRTSKTIMQAKQPIYNLEAGLIANLQNLQNNNQGDINKAESSFIKAITTSPSYSNALYSLGLVYQKQNKNKEALELFKKVLELNPENKEVKNKISELE